MSSRELDIIVKAKDDASSKISKMNKSMQASLKKTALAATAMGAALAVGLKKSLDAAVDAERAQRQLETAIVSLSGGTQQQVDRIMSYTNAMEKKIGIDADALNMGAAQLGTFQLQSDTVEALTKSVADLTVNNYGLAASGDQYIQSANDISKALRGQFGILEKQGIVFTEAQQNIILHGTEMEKAAAIQEGFTQNLRETTDTVSGLEVTQAKLTQTMGEVSEKIGTALAPALTQLGEAMLPVIEKVSEWIQNNSELVVKLIKIASVILPILVLLPLVTTAVGALSTALLFLAANPIVIVIAAIAAMVAALIWLWNNSDMVRGKISAAWTKIKEVIGAAVSAIKERIGNFITNVNEKISGFFEALKEIFKGGMDFIKGIWDGAWGAMSSFASGILDKISGFVGGLIDKIGKAIGKIKEFLGLSEEAATRSVNTRNSRTSPKKSATGGNVFKGQTSLVGENGPELVQFGKTGTVIPNNRIGGGGGTTVNVYLSNNTLLGDSNEIGVQLGDMIINQLRLQTRLS